MSGEERLRAGDVPDVAAMMKAAGVEDAVLTDEQAKALAQAVDRSCRAGEQISTVLAVILKVLKGVVLVLVLAVGTIGCAPRPVVQAHDASTKAIMHYVHNVDAEHAGWRAAFKAAVEQKIEENWEDALRENAPDGKIVVDKVLELLEAKRAYEAKLAERIAAADELHAKNKRELYSALSLNAAVGRYLAGRSVTAEDLEQLVELAVILARRYVPQEGEE